MIDKQLRCEIAQSELIISVAKLLNFDSSITRFIKSGSRCSLSCIGGTYKLLRGYPPSPPGTLTRRHVRTFKRYLYHPPLIVKSIVFHILTKVDGHVSRVDRDKCPEDS